MTPKQRLRKYIEWRKQARGIDREHIHGFSPGSPSEVTLLLSDIEALLALAEPEQEPVYYEILLSEQRTGNVYRTRDVAENEMARLNAAYGGNRRIRPLYASPQPREWKELSEDEIKAANEKAYEFFTGLRKSDREYVNAISADLRAKNGFPE